MGNYGKFLAKNYTTSNEHRSFNTGTFHSADKGDPRNKITVNRKF